MNCNATLSTTPRDQLQQLTSTSTRPQPGQPKATGKRPTPDTGECHPLWVSPSEQPQDCTASLIARDYQNPERYKKILATKGLDR